MCEEREGYTTSDSGVWMTTRHSLQLCPSTSRLQKHFPVTESQEFPPGSVPSGLQVQAAKTHSNNVELCMCEQQTVSSVVFARDVRKGRQRTMFCTRGGMVDLHRQPCGPSPSP